MLALLLALSVPPYPAPVLIQDATLLTAAELEQLDGRVVRVRAESLHNAWEGVVGLDGPAAGVGGGGSPPLLSRDRRRRPARLRCGSRRGPPSRPRSDRRPPPRPTWACRASRRS